MNLKSLSKLIPFPSRKASILVCETDGFHLRGAVINRDGEQLTVAFSARSEATDYKVAVAEVVAALRDQDWGGHDAILLTPGAFSTLIELPVSPAHPRPPIQMQEMIRWELEPLLMQHNMLWSVGQILLGLGYLTEAQIADVLDRQQGKQKGGSLGENAAQVYSLKRYGELAIEMGYITPEQMDECLAKQAWLRSDGDEFGCGWAAQVSGGYDKDAAGEAGTYSWLVSGANLGMMRQWELAFAAAKVELKEVYPLVGCAAALLDEMDDAVLLEAHAGLVSGVRIQSDAVSMVRLQQSTLSSVLDACLETYHGLVPPETKKVWLTTAFGESDGLDDGLSGMIGRAIDWLPLQSREATPGMLGAALDFLKPKGSRRCCSVSVRGPRPPIWQRVEARAVAACLLLLLVIGVLELTLLVRSDLAQGEHARVADAKKDFDAAVARAQAQIDAVNKVKADIGAKEAELSKLADRFDFFAIELPARASFIQSLLEDMAATMTEDVVVNVIEETPNYGFRVAGWALSDVAAQQFIQSFKAAMATWGMDIADPIVRAQAGRLGLMGYDMHFRLVQIKDEPEAVPAAATPAAQPGTRKRARR
ncbi:hypothetical protein MTYP_00412 [Methylophilaceae bacterium]|nr:hypothetical protein MTYP_00412 [Methylophilaceae bacterium]